jgi:hypothetical protein
MLDRKTKDREASIELLEDRIKQSKKFLLLLYFVGLIIFVMACLNYFVTMLVGMTTIVLFLALFVFMGMYYMSSYIDKVDLLIYLKKCFKDKEMK